MFIKLPDGMVDTLSVECHQHEMVVMLTTVVPFHGMVYPRGLTKKSPCMAEYDVQLGDQFTYKVPLRSCNTMFTDTVRMWCLLCTERVYWNEQCFLQENGYIEYFNTIVIQPHKKLVTNQGKGYQIRCKYNAKDVAIITGYNARYNAPLFPCLAFIIMKGFGAHLIEF